MDYKRLVQLMRDPGKNSPETVSSLQELIAEFPYFQTAHILLARSMKDMQHIRFDKQLKLASAYAADRNMLFSLIHDKKMNGEEELQEPTVALSSPFILDSEPEIPAAEAQDETKNLGNENPFVQSTNDVVPAPPDSLIKTPELSKEDLFPLPEETEKAEPRYAHDPEELFSGGFKEGVPPETIAEESVSDDPREILRRRLAEILGNPGHDAGKPVDNTPPSVTAKERTQEVITPSQAEISGTTEVSIIEEKISQETPELQSKETKADTKDISEDVSATNTKTDDPVNEILSADAPIPADPIDKLEIGYALEESFLQSLENLPEINPPSFGQDEAHTHPAESKIPESDATTESAGGTFSFIDWVRKHRGNEYGKVEEVHADDTEISNEPIDGSDLKEGTPSRLKGLETDALIITQEKTGKQDAFKEKPGSVKEKKELIDKFIASEPKIVPSRAEFYSPISQAKKSVEEHQDLVSETLARIYRQQGHPLKARACYEKLSLFYPEKSTYFAALIKEIDEEIHQSNTEDL